MREKLIELLESVPHAQRLYPDLYVDSLIANGVTVREEGGCEYCLEDRDGYRRGFGAFSLHNPFHASGWEISTGHCKPRKIYFCPMCGRKLTEPPKEENL